jgi:hypothetical protein
LAFVLWKLQKGQHVLGALLLMDAVDCACMELTGLELFDDEAHESIRNKLKRTSSPGRFAGEFATRYSAIRKIRNNVAHATPTEIADISQRLVNEAKWVLNACNNANNSSPERDALLEWLK